MTHTSIIVVYKNGRPSSGHQVSLSFSTGVTKDFMTDSSGVARVQHDSNGHAKIFVDGNHSSHGTTLDAPGKKEVYL